MASEVSIDERAWNGEALINPNDPYWKTVNPKNVHLLFYESDFFDRMSNNQALLNQAQYDERIFKILFDRRTFEQAVTEMPSGGLEFITLQEPHPVANFEQGFNDPRYEPHGTNGTYVFQKQNRKKVPGKPDEITVLGHYYMIGFTVTQAPSLYDVLTSQFLYVTYHIDSAFKKVQELPVFNPSQEYYTYFKPNTKTGATHGPRPGSSSRASTPPPDTASQGANSKSVAAQTSARAAEASLFESLTLAMRYANEYMDENPLMGEPGSFVFSSTNTHVQHQNQQKQAQEQAKAAAAAKATVDSETPTASPTPKPLTEVQLVALQNRKGSKDADKSRQPSVAGVSSQKKRKKSKAPGSPTSPTAGSPLTASPAGNSFS